MTPNFLRGARRGAQRETARFSARACENNAPPHTHTHKDMVQVLECEQYEEDKHDCNISWPALH